MERGQSMLDQILWELREHEIEDGRSHPAERILHGALIAYPTETHRWIADAFDTTLEWRPEVAHALVRLLGRLPMELVGPQGRLVALAALHYPDETLRDYAARAFEHWGGAQSLTALNARAKVEPIEWLRDYMRQVVREAEVA